MTDCHETQIRVRYCETDAMGYLHHSHYLNYFEVARTELFRALGGNYRLMEERGYLLVVVKATINYHRPARYDDVLTVRCRVNRQTAAKLIHGYEVRRDDELLTSAETVLACVDRQGQVQRLSDEILYGAPGLSPG